MPGLRRPTSGCIALFGAVPADRLAEERQRMRPLPATMPDLDRRYLAEWNKPAGLAVPHRDRACLVEQQGVHVTGDLDRAQSR